MIPSDALGRPWQWIAPAAIEAIHDAQLAEHGGLAGTRDGGALTSALARPQNLALYETPDVAALAAAYGYGISRNHPFLDGNKRTGFMAVVLFLALNGYRIEAPHTDCVLTMLAVAAGEITEAAFADWLRMHLQSR
jgi:death-on-curing protein